MSDRFIKTAVIGYPVSHSLSPLIHNSWIAEHNLQGSYEAIAIKPEDLQREVHRLVSEGFAGFNVTIPHKQAIMALCDDIDETAQKIGAVNTVTITPDGKLYGTNTDSFGFIENMLQSGVAIDAGNTSTLVLGAGGAARAVIYGLKEFGIKDIRITNRTKEKADEIAQEFSAMSLSWEERNSAAKNAGLIINTTALGMKGQKPLDLDLQGIVQGCAVYDIVYNPLHTDLLTAAKKQGCQVVTGIGMLLHQARPAFAKWYGVMPEVTPALEKKILEALS